jgi:hypothetical protein
MFCSQCGAQILENSKYCMKYGVKIEILTQNQIKEVDVAKLKKQFRDDMFNIYREASKIGYRPSNFLRMISDTRDIVDIERQLIAKETSGFEKLVHFKKLIYPWNIM